MNNNFIFKLFSLAIKTKWMPAVQNCQILSVDNGVEYLKFCFPKNARYFHLPARGEVIYLSPRIVLLSLCFLANRKKSGLGLRGIYIAAIARILRPAVIVTMIDNNNWDTNLSSFTGIPIVYTANGLRHPSHFPNKNFYCYFSMNTALTDSALSFSNSFEEFCPVGHIKMSLFYEKYIGADFTSTNPEKTTLLWISQYRESIYNGKLEINRQQKETELMGLNYLSRYCIVNCYEQRVAIASARKRVDKESELRHFNAATNGNISYCNNVSGAWDSYEEVKKADLVLGMFSTLLFESLSVGKRVLFLLPDKHQTLKKYIGESIRIDLLSPLVFSGQSFDEFSEKCSEILSLSDSEYLDLIDSFRDDVACFDKVTLPHHHLRNKLLQLIQDR